MSNVQRNVEDIKSIPYEGLTEQMATEKLREIIGKHGSNPDEIFVRLQSILHEHGHDCLVMGLQLAGNYSDIGPVDLVQTYNPGWRKGFYDAQIGDTKL